MPYFTEPMSADQAAEKIRLHQIGLNYNPEQDRILLLIKMSDFSEVRGWITRRFLTKFWPVLLKCLDNYVDTMPQATSKTSEAKEAIRAFQHAEKVKQSNFTESFDKRVSNTPLGSEPLLFSRIALKPGPGKLQTVGLYPSKGQGIELALNDTLLHSLCKLLIDGEKAAEWGLNLTIPGADTLLAPTHEASQKLN